MPCRNERRGIEPALRSILTQRAEGFELEVIVADGMSDDGTRDILSRLAAEDARVRVVDNPDRSTPAGLNRAIRAARGTVIARVDAHATYDPSYLVECVRALDETNADNVGGPAVTRAEGYVQRAIAAAFHSPWSTGGAKFHDRAFEGSVDTVQFGCWRKELFDRVGLFDEELIRNQDDEHNLRIVRMGGKVWQSPKIKLWYSPRGSFSELFDQYKQYGYWKVRVIQKHRLPASLRHLVPGLFVATVGGLALISPVNPAAFGALAAGGTLYAAALAAASIATAKDSGWDLLPVLPFVFATYHFGYGVGFLSGVLDFVLLDRGPRKSAFELSRRV
ncbi:MAG: glycosyltransferase family 2 protein [Deltaproteobacteria bacterium]|nr:glycosyltransferase family 2 protein [Deltaproteobacteria bacterium]